MGYAQVTPIIGAPQQSFAASVLGATQQFPLGTIIQAVDSYLGPVELMYCQFPASAAIPFGRAVTFQGAPGGNQCQAIINPTTANTARPLGFTITDVPSAAYVQYGWVAIGGNVIMKASASVAAGTTIGIDAATAGSVGANTAGRQVLGGVSVAPSTTTVVKNWTIQNGSNIAKCPQGLDGLFPGAALSGTGVSGTITSLDVDNRTITMSANASATGVSAVTATYTGFIVGFINRPSVQGAIT